MNVIQTNIDGVVIIEPHIFEDARGYFFESFSQRMFAFLDIVNEYHRNKLIQLVRFYLLQWAYLYGVPTFSDAADLPAMKDFMRNYKVSTN